MTSFGVARLVAAKDLRIEMRSRILVNQVLPFAAIVMVLFAFALDKDDLLARVAPGLVWLATLFSMLVVVQRSFAVEAADGALDALQTAGVPAQGIFSARRVPWPCSWWCSKGCCSSPHSCSTTVVSAPTAWHC